MGQTLVLTIKAVYVLFIQSDCYFMSTEYIDWVTMVRNSNTGSGNLVSLWGEKWK